MARTSTSLHRCPSCKTIGKVNRSKPRGVKEKIRLKLMPVYSVYRCHNCNWRGWLVRSTSSTMERWLMLGGYALAAALILGGIIYVIIKKWPSAEYMY